MKRDVDGRLKESESDLCEHVSEGHEVEFRSYDVEAKVREEPDGLKNIYDQSMEMEALQSGVNFEVNDKLNALLISLRGYRLNARNRCPRCIGNSNETRQLYFRIRDSSYEGSSGP